MATTPRERTRCSAGPARLRVPALGRLRLLAQLPPYSACPIQRERMDVDVVVLGVLHDCLDQIGISTHAAATRPACVRRDQANYDRPGLGRGANVDVGAGPRKRDVGDRKLEAHLLQARIQPQQSRTAAVGSPGPGTSAAPVRAVVNGRPPSSANAPMLSTSAATSPTHTPIRNVRRRIRPPPSNTS
jgi:hypothetical protein